MTDQSDAAVECAARALCDLRNDRDREAVYRGMERGPHIALDFEDWREEFEEEARVVLRAYAAFDEARNGIHATPDQGSQPAHTNEDRCPDCRTPAGARHYCDKAPAFFIPEAKLASDEPNNKED